MLAALGWPGVIGVAAAVGMAFSGVRLALLAALGFAFLGCWACGTRRMAVLSMLIAARRCSRS